MEKRLRHFDVPKYEDFSFFKNLVVEKFRVRMNTTLFRFFSKSNVITVVHYSTSKEIEIV